MKVKVFNLEQPYAYLIGRYKFWETRGSNISYRGKIAIYATKKINADVYAELADLLPPMEELATGAIVAIADLTDCQFITGELRSQQFADELRCGIWEREEGNRLRYACKLENIIILDEPIPVKGVMPGQWSLDLADETFNNSQSDRWNPADPDDYSSLNEYEQAWQEWNTNQKQGDFKLCSQPECFSQVAEVAQKGQKPQGIDLFGQLTTTPTLVPSTEPGSQTPCSLSRALPLLQTSLFSPFPFPISSYSHRLVQTFPLLENEPELMELADNCFLRESDSFGFSAHLHYCLRTLTESLAQIKELPSRKSSKRLQSWGMWGIGKLKTETATSPNQENDFSVWAITSDVVATEPNADKPSLQSIIGDDNAIVFRASSGDRAYTEESPTLRSLTSTGKHQGGSGAFKIQEGDTLRPLTATEAEQIMGWLVDSTKIGINEEGEKICMSQTQRIKTLGNGIIPGEITELLTNLRPILERRLEKEVPRSKKIAYKQLRRLGKTHREALSMVVQ